MAKVKTNIGNDYCPQALFLYGTKQEDGQPHFGLFCWFEYYHSSEGLGVMACIGEEKQTKDLIRKNGVFSANLVSEQLLPLADYYGCTCGKTTPDKMKRLPTVEWGQVLDVPTILESPVSFELEVKKEIPMGDGSDIFLCLIRNVTQDEKLLGTTTSFTERLMQAAPVLAPGDGTYSSIDGRYLGKWGEPMKNMSNVKEKLYNAPVFWKNRLQKVKYMNLLKYGDTIGIISPSWVANPNDYERYAKGIEKLGFHVKFGKNIYKDTYKYTASVAERVDDLNEMIYDENVRLIFFGGGYGSVDLLPYIDYNRIKEKPKLFLSYSDGTTILNAIHANTGITTYYGQTPGLFDNISEYDRKQFVSHLIDGDVTDYISNSDWYTITEGCCEGSLVGGYLLNFVLTLGNKYFPYSTDKNYILFIEESDKFQSVQDVSMFLTCIGQSRLMEQVTGLLFGHYSDDTSPLLFEVLERFGKKYNIPVAYCDDFGHGSNHAIFPIGRGAVLDTKNKTLLFQ